MVGLGRMKVVGARVARTASPHGPIHQVKATIAPARFLGSRNMGTRGMARDGFHAGDTIWDTYRDCRVGEDVSSTSGDSEKQDGGNIV